MSALFDTVRDNMAATPYHVWLKPVLVSADVDSVEIELAYRPELAGQQDRPEFHGGILSALVDIAGHAAIVTRTGRGVATIDMRVDYLRPASGTLSARAEIIKFGRTIGIVDVRVSDDRQKPVAAGRAAYFTGTASA